MYFVSGKGWRFSLATIARISGIIPIEISPYTCNSTITGWIYSNELDNYCPDICPLCFFFVVVLKSHVHLPLPLSLIGSLTAHTPLLPSNLPPSSQRSRSNFTWQFTTLASASNADAANKIKWEINFRPKGWGFALLSFLLLNCWGFTLSFGDRWAGAVLQITPICSHIQTQTDI